MEIYRFLIDGYLIQEFCELSEKDFVLKREVQQSKRYGKREYLNDVEQKI
jgi:hypothetical protein